MKNIEKVVLKFVAVVFKIAAIIGAFAVPGYFTVVLPLSNMIKYYHNGGEGLGVIIKNVLIMGLLTPLLAVIIFCPLFVIGSVLYDWCTEGFKPPQNQPQQPQPMPYNPMDDFFIVKEDNPHASDAGIAEMNWRMSHQDDNKGE
jgi:hypothetical protein